MGLIPSGIWSQGANMASTLGQLRPGTEATWRPKKARIRWGLGFSEHQGLAWHIKGLSARRQAFLLSLSSSCLRLTDIGRGERK